MARGLPNGSVGNTDQDAVWPIVISGLVLSGNAFVGGGKPGSREVIAPAPQQ